MVVVFICSRYFKMPTEANNYWLRRHQRVGISASYPVTRSYNRVQLHTVFNAPSYRMPSRVLWPISNLLVRTLCGFTQCSLTSINDGKYGYSLYRPMHAFSLREYHIDNLYSSTNGSYMYVQLHNKCEIKLLKR